MRLNSEVYILLAQQDWVARFYQQAHLEEGTEFSFYPIDPLLKQKSSRQIKSCTMNIFLQIFLLCCFDGGIPVQLGRHKTKAVHFYLERSRNHLSAMSLPTSTVKSSTINPFSTGNQGLLNLFARKIGSTHTHICTDSLREMHNQTHQGKPDSMENATVRASSIPGMRASR